MKEITSNMAGHIFEKGSRYRIVGELGRGTGGVVYHAYDRERDLPVALKTLHNLGAEEIYQLKHEFRALQGIVHPNLCRLIELVEDGGVWFFAMELIDGVDFLTHVRGSGEASVPVPAKGEKAPSLPQENRTDGFDEERLRRALGDVASGLSALHLSGRVHRDVKPSNVLVNDRDQAILLDFGLVLEQTDSRTTMIGGGGTPEYMAPEQIDAVRIGPAADCYALGVMLYEALTGVLPYEGGVATILMQKQIGPPPPPSSRCASIPADLEELSMALLRREPKERPTADDILEALQAAPATTRRINSHFTSIIASRTVSEVFGREGDLSALHRAFEESLRGNPVTVVVEGVSGVGKSVLVHKFLSDLHQSIPEVVELSGRCYERESVPFKAFDAVVDALVVYLRRQSDHFVAQLLPDDVTLLARLFPQLNRVFAIGNCPQISSEIIDPREMQRRAFLVLRDILRRIRENAPLVVAVDDMQWTDKDSLLLLESILGTGDTPPLLLVLSSRIAEGNSQLQLDWKTIIPGEVRTISLGPLDYESSLEFARRCLEKTRASSPATLAAGIAEEADGHPLYIAELALFLDQSEDRELTNARLGDVIWSRITKLPRNARRLLELVCVSGLPLRVDYLREFLALHESELLSCLSLLRAGNLTRSRGTRNRARLEPYHDRVRIAVMEQLTHQDKVKNLQLRLGKFLHRKFLQSEFDENIFEITRHLNDVAELLVSSSERFMLFELNFQAGKISREGAAYVAALDFFMRSRALVEEDAWTKRYDTVFELQLVTAEAAYLAGDYSLTETLVLETMKRVQSIVDKAKVAEVYILSLIGEGKWALALDQAIAITKELGVSLPRRPNKMRFVSKLLATKMMLKGRTPQNLAELPLVDNARIVAAKKLMQIIGTTAYLEEPLLFAFTGLEGVSLCVKFGNDEMSAMTYGSYGVINSVVLNNHEEGYRFGKLSLQLLEDYEVRRSRPMVLFIWACFVQHFKEHARRSLPYFLESYRAAKEVGDPIFLGHASANYCLVSFSTGRNLFELAKECESYAKEQREAKQFFRLNTTRIYHQAALNLLGRAACPLELSGAAFAGTGSLAKLRENNEGLNVFHYYLTTMILQYLFGSYEKAFQTALSIEEESSRNIGSFSNTIAYFYRAIVIIAWCGEAGAHGQRKHLNQVEQYLKKIGRWAAFSPENHLHRCHLIKAELARLRGRDNEALPLYAQAIELALKNEFVQDAAIAAELAAKFYLARGDIQSARTQLEDAIRYYASWGARAKVDQLKEEHATWIYGVNADSNDRSVEDTQPIDIGENV